MNKMMLSCTKATELIEKNAFDGLSTTENIRLSMHTTMCYACKQYQKQSILLNKAISNHLNSFSFSFTEKKIHLESQAKQRIQREIENHLEKM